MQKQLDTMLQSRKLPIFVYMYTRYPLIMWCLQVADNKDNITAAIESLAVAQPQQPGLAFGPCIDGLLEAFEEDVCCSLRLLAVMAHRCGLATRAVLNVLRVWCFGL